MVFDCDALAVKRADTLGKYFIDPKVDQLDILDVIEFLKSADLENKSIPEDHLTNLNPPNLSGWPCALDRKQKKKNLPWVTNFEKLILNLLTS